MTDSMQAWTERRSSEGNLADPHFHARVDQGRLIHSMAFRRLQGKTQVMSVGENDFFRTRLTHSLEVANIGQRILERMRWFAERNPEGKDIKAWLPPFPLIEMSCLAHDLGHPAYGHSGERILNYYMHPYGGFEGNGQTLRLLTRLGEYSESDGYNMSRRSLLSVLKYPALFADVKPDYPAWPDILPRNIQAWSPPKCVHDDEADVLNFLLDPFSTADQDAFMYLEHSDKGMRPCHKSLDCSMMELADDIAYGIHDLEDALAMGLLSSQKVCSDLGHELRTIARQKNGGDRDYYQRLIASDNPKQLKRAITNMVKYMVDNTVPVELEAFEHPLLRYQITMRDEARTILTRLKQYVLNEVILQPRLRTLEYKGQMIISQLFEAFLSDPKGLLPRAISTQFEPGDDVRIHRAISDYIASMTDGEAASMYERLYLPGNGSVFEPM